jgi:hypothetical protein
MMFTYNCAAHPALIRRFDLRALRCLPFILIVLVYATSLQAQENSAPLVISLAPAVCLTPLGRSTYPVPYPVVEKQASHSKKAVSSVVGVDGCGTMRSPALYREKAAPKNEGRSQKKSRAWHAPRRSTIFSVIGSITHLIACDLFFRPIS